MWTHHRSRRHIHCIEQWHRALSWSSRSLKVHTIRMSPMPSQCRHYDLWVSTIEARHHLWFDSASIPHLRRDFCPLSDCSSGINIYFWGSSDAFCAAKTRAASKGITSRLHYICILHLQLRLCEMGAHARQGESHHWGRSPDATDTKWAVTAWAEY